MGVESQMGNSRNPGRIGWAGTFLLLFLCLGLLAGCTRKFFRKGADREVEEVLDEKNHYAEWSIRNFYVYPDARSRFADNSNPDRPPMPPDDPAAWADAPKPQKPGKAGVQYMEGTGYLELLGQWDAENRIEVAKRGKRKRGSFLSKLEGDKPDQPDKSKDEVDEATPTFTSKKRPFLIKLNQAIELGLINSREYQDRREDLYLTALPVTLERFAFAGQFFFLEQVIRSWSGRQSPEGYQNRWRPNTTSAGFSKLFSTGGLLLLNVANQTVIEFSRLPRHVVSTSNMTLDFIQPLLKGGGRAVTLEPLTQVERNLLYAIRDFAHYHRDFYTYIAGGLDFSRGSIISPSALSRAILPPTVSASGGLNARVQVSPGQGSRLGSVLPGAPLSTGFLPTLSFMAQLDNERQNVLALEKVLKYFDNLKEGGDISQLQVDQVEQQLLPSKSNVLRLEQQVRDSLDEFKLQLGVPVNVPLELDEDPIRPIAEQLDRYQTVIDEFDAASRIAEKRFVGIPHVAQLRVNLRKLVAEASLTHGTKFRTEFSKRWAVLEKLTAKQLQDLVTQLSAERRKLLDEKTDLETKSKTFPKAKADRVEVVERSLIEAEFEKKVRAYLSEPWKAIRDPQRRDLMVQNLYRDLANNFLLILAEARNERVEALRTRWPALAAVCLDGADLLKVGLDDAEFRVEQSALTNRLDLMNARAQLVDSWRQIAVAANSLLATVNVEYKLDSFTPAGLAQPVNFGGSRNRHQLILNADLPLVRTSERNNYRSALIGFQRQRRAMMALEDIAVQTGRVDLRLLRQLGESYKIFQRAIELAYLQVDNALDTFSAPPDPSIAQRGSAANAAALTQQLLGAQQRLLQTQNQIYATWINFQIARMQLYRDLDLMQVDNRGVWIDEHATCDGTHSGKSSGGSGSKKQRTSDRLLEPEPIPIQEEKGFEHGS